MIVSHFDSDHAGGYQALFSYYNPKWTALAKDLNLQSRSVVSPLRLIIKLV
ncbi:hypothetical protein O9992_15680 [Vibrio lentus]|nr:hypothetical protein [Vibrio lentus]